MKPAEPAGPAGPAGADELELQARWAAGDWHGPWIEAAGAPTRVAFAGTWNRGAGPDFRGAILLDREGRARRGDVELHCRPSGWRAHGHAGDPAYAGVALHVVGRGGRGSGGPPLAVLPEAGPEEPGRREPAGWKNPPCARPARLPDAAAIEALLERLALRRLQAKTALQRRRIAELGPGRAGAAVLARALGQPRNADLLERALLAADDGRAAPAAAAIETAIGAVTGAEPARVGWQRGRGAADRPAGAATALAALLKTWRASVEKPEKIAERAARIALGGRAGAGELLLPGLIGPARAARIAGDFAAPFALAALAAGGLDPGGLGGGEPPAERIARLWLDGPDARHLHTRALRGRIEAMLPPDSRGSRSRSQALLELERGWCAHGACAICPVAALAGRGPGRPASAPLSEYARPRPPVPSPNLGGSDAGPAGAQAAAGEKTAGPDVP